MQELIRVLITVVKALQVQAVVLLTGDKISVGILKNSYGKHKIIF
jgi:hypothetical protein